MQSPETGTYLERSKDSERAPILMNIHVKKMLFNNKEKEYMVTKRSLFQKRSNCPIVELIILHY